MLRSNGLYPHGLFNFIKSIAGLNASSLIEMNSAEFILALTKKVMCSVYLFRKVVFKKKDYIFYINDNFSKGYVGLLSPSKH